MDAKSIPKGADRSKRVSKEAKWARLQQGNQMDPKETQREPRGYQTGSKWIQKGAQRDQLFYDVVLMRTYTNLNDVILEVLFALAHWDCVWTSLQCSIYNVWRPEDTKYLFESVH